MVVYRHGMTHAVIDYFSINKLLVNFNLVIDMTLKKIKLNCNQFVNLEKITMFKLIKFINCTNILYCCKLRTRV